MSKEFEFRIVGNEASFIRLLETNHIDYHQMPEEAQEKKIAEMPPSEPWIHITEVVLQLVIALTPFALEKIWKWYKRKGKDSKLSVKVEGNLLELDAKTMKTLSVFLDKASKMKTRRKRGEQR